MEFMECFILLINKKDRKKVLKKLSDIQSVREMGKNLDKKISCKFL